MGNSLLSRTTTALAAAAIGVAILGGTAAAIPANNAANNWAQLAEQGYAESEKAVRDAEANGTYVRAQFIAPLAWYAAEKYGWQDKRTQDWLHKLYDLRTDTGGYGLGEPYDAFHDGTTNPADTAYTITGAWHVGRVLIAGLEAGAVPKERVQELATWMAKVPLAAGNECAAYSETGNDKGKPCVWNVSAAAAWFLWRADRLGAVPDADKDAVLAKIRSWRNHVRAHYSPQLGGWTYQAGTPGLQDPGHNIATVLPMLELDPGIGKQALAGHFRAYPSAASNVDALPGNCDKADASFDAIKAAMTKPASSPKDVLASRSGYPPFLLRVGENCA